MSYRFTLIVSLVIVCLLSQTLMAQDWLDQQGQPIKVAPSQLKLATDSDSEQIQAGATEIGGLWINVAAGNKLPKSSYFTQKFKYAKPIHLDKQAHSLTIENVESAGTDFKRVVIMFNSNDKTACGIAINSDTTGDLLRLDTRGQYKIRKSIKFKLPATFTFAREADQVKILLDGKDISDKLDFPYEAPPASGGTLTVESQLIRVVGNAIAISLKPGDEKKPTEKPVTKMDQDDVPQMAHVPTHRKRIITLPVDNKLTSTSLTIDTKDKTPLTIKFGSNLIMSQLVAGQSKTLYKMPVQNVFDANQKTLAIELTQLGPYCFIKLHNTLLGMIICDATDVTATSDGNQALISDWQTIAFTPRMQRHPEQTIPKVAIQNVLGWVPPDTFTTSLVNATHDFPVTPPVDDVHRDIRQMYAYGWNVAAVDFTFFADYRVQRQYHMLRDWIKATEQEKLDDFYVIPYLEVGTVSKQAKKDGKQTSNARIEVDAIFTAMAMIYLMEEYGNHPNWLKFQGRPVFGIYRVNHNAPQYWQDVRSHLKQYGWDPYIFGDLGSLQTAIHGTFDYDEWRPYGEVMDGIYSFSASLLEVSLDLPPKFRQCFSTLKNPPAIGCTVRPGYLSARPYNKNWISHRGTEIVEKSWEKAMQYEPAFIHATTWNDYNEATQFSNSFSLSTSQLEIGQYYLNKYFNKPMLQGKADEPYAVLSYFKVTQGNEPVRFRVLSLPTQRSPKQGQWQLTLLDQNDKTLAQTTSDLRDLSKPDTWLWQWDGAISRDQSRVVKVRLQFHNTKGAKTYHHIPDIAVIDGNTYGDELYYLVPLHRLAGNEKSIDMQVNQVSGQAIARHESIVDLKLKLTGAAPEKTHVSVAANSYLLRLAADLTQSGAWCVPSYGYHGATIAPGDPAESARFINVRQENWPNGNVYYCAQAQFDDGTVAWSPTYFALNAYDAQDVSAQWVFTPNFTNDDAKLLDRTYRKLPLEAAPGDPSVEYVRLPGKFDVMQMNGHQRFYTALDALPNGPCAMEVVFRPDAVNREQILCVQRGAQATLLVNADGYLAARRLRQVREYPNFSTEVLSKQPLIAGKLYQAIIVYNGSNLSLYLNGRLENQAPCTGRRSTEMFVVGGPALPRTLITDKGTIDPALQQVIREIDGLHESSFYKGLLIRLTLMSRALTNDEVYASFQRLQAASFWE